MSYQTSTFIERAPCIVLYERQALVRQGLRYLLEYLGFRVVAEAADVRDFVRACHTRPDVIVADQRCEIDAARLKEICPATKVIVLVDNGVSQAEAERLGYTVSKNADATTLGSAVRRVCGETGRGSPLRARDWEVLRLLATGRTNKEIGSALGVTEKTVRQRLTEIFASIGVRNRTEAALYALGYRNFWAEAQPERSAA